MLRRTSTGRPPSPPDTELPTSTPISVNVSRVDDPDEPAIGAIDVDRWARLVSSVLAAEGVAGPGELNVLFVGDDEIAELNIEHLGHEGPTDVLSFPIDGVDELELGEVRLVGDILVSPATAARNAPEHAGSFEDEIALLVVHGTLHLLGHDHAEPGERDRMWARERELLAELHGPLVRDPWGRRPRLTRIRPRCNCASACAAPTSEPWTASPGN